MTRLFGSVVYRKTFYITMIGISLGTPSYSLAACLFGNKDPLINCSKYEFNLPIDILYKVSDTQIADPHSGTTSRVLIENNGNYSQPITGVIGRTTTSTMQNGLIAEAYGVHGDIQHSGEGTISYASGLRTSVRNISTGSITSASGISVLSPINSGTGTIGTYYGIYIGTPDVATNNFAIYSQGGKNYFGGKIYASEICDNAGANCKIISDGWGSGGGGGGGSGTVTSITAGTGLTGGTITTAGTIAVDVGTTANKIVQLNATAALPALNGTNLTNVNATKILTKVVTLTSPTSGQYLRYNGTGFTNGSIAISEVTNLSTQLGNKLDASNMPASCTSNQTLTFTSPTGMWACSNIVITPSTFGSQNAGYVMIAPENASGTPTFRRLTLADLPSGSGGGTGSLWTENSGDVYRATGKVGIGTTAPSYPLDVNGEQSFALSLNNTDVDPEASTGILFRTNNTYRGGMQFEGNGSQGTSIILNSTDDNGDESLRFLINSRGMVGIAGVPRYMMDVIAPTTYTEGKNVLRLMNQSAYGTSIRFDSVGPMSEEEEFKRKFGEKGLGAIPRGSITFESTPITPITKGMILTGSVFSLKTIDTNMNEQERMHIDVNGNVGFGTHTPGSRLEVAGAIRADEICDRAGTNCKDISTGWGSSGAGTLTSITAGTGLTGGTITTTGTIAVDVGTTANKIVQLNATAALPALNGTNLTNVNATKILTKVVTLTAPTSGQYLRYNGTGFTNGSIAISEVTNLSTQLGSKLDSSNMPTSCSSNQTLTFTSPTGMWACSNIVVTPAVFGTVAQNRVMASPDGSSGTPTFRTLTSNDIPESVKVAKILDSGIQISPSSFASGVGSGNLAIGKGNPLKLLTSGSSNFAIGEAALANTTVSSGNIAIGDYSITNSTSGSQNTAVGYGSMQYKSGGSNNVAYGTGALGGLGVSNFSTAIGVNAGAQNNGGSVTAVGYAAGYFNSSGSVTAVGSHAANKNTTGNVIAVGDFSARENTVGSIIAIGSSAGTNNTTGTSNIAIGPNALIANTTGASNIAIGFSSANQVITGSGNIILGSSTTNLGSSSANNIVIGNSIALNTSGASNVLAIGNAIYGLDADGSSSVTNAKIGIGTKTPGSLLDVAGTLRVDQICDRTGSNCKTLAGGWSMPLGDNDLSKKIESLQSENSALRKELKAIAEQVKVLAQKSQPQNRKVAVSR